VTTPSGYGQSPGDGWHGNDPQPWDPAYPHPQQIHHPYGYGYPPPPPYAPPPPPPRPRQHRALVGAVIFLAAALVAALVVIATGVTRTTNGNAVASGGSSNGSSGGSSGGGTTPGNGQFPFPNNGPAQSSTGKATAAQQVGVVDVLTVIDYGRGEAAGTGMVLTSNGDVLTNNHVVDGATSIKVRIVSTGKTYTARVVGTAPSKDIAVIHLAGASGLQTANYGDSNTLAVGDKVTGVGNAGGTGGTPSAASGKVTELHRTITASDESGGSSERLHDVIVTDAPIQSGDSGGPLYNANDQVVGIDTAASTNGTRVGFAIPIDNAVSIARQIEKGVETSAIHIGYPGFLGVTVVPSNGSGALIQDALRGGPAAKAGIGSGDTITRVGSTAIRSSNQLHNYMTTTKPGSKVQVSFTDPATGSHTVTITLATGPAD
jgi:S1-C subfamily serine protease